MGLHDKKYGLLGEKLGHSYSPQIHRKLADYDYRLYEVSKENVAAFLNETELGGMNVTIPYKKTVMEHCVYLSDIAKRVGAVNTLVRHEDGWYGYNTDYYGFKALINKHGIAVSGRKCLVFGSGGASNTACRVLEDLGAAEVIVISRSGENNYSNLHLHKDAQILVNTTPVGMYPANGNAAFDPAAFPACEAVIDVIYNPARTEVMLRAEAAGIKTAGGLYMLTAQAKRSAELFTGSGIADSRIDDITDELAMEMQNIILIGMPGSGKSVIARGIAQKTGRRLIDIDKEIVARTGKEIPDIFAEGGERAFREIETETLREFGRLSGCVIATGGGTVTREENYAPLHQNGRIYWIKRDLRKLAVKGRPISLSRTAEDIYAERRAKYERFADVAVDNNGSIDAAVRAVLKKK